MIDQGLIQNFVIYAIHVRNRAIPGGDLVGSIESMMWVPGIAPIAIFLPLVFPTGNLLSRRWRPVLWVAIVAMIAAFVGNGLSPSTDSTSYIAGVRPVLLPEPFSAITGALSGAIVVLPLCAIAGIVALVVRYRRGTPDERHQIKWMLFASGFYAFGFAGSLVPGILGHNIPILEDFGVLGLVLVPVAAAIAVLKYRLYEIDRLISRTLSYAIVTGLLIGVYVGLVTLATRVLPFSSPLGVAASTLAAAALFNPLRKRVQRLVDHRFNRARYDAEATVAAFAQRVRDDVDLDAVSSEFVRAVQASVEPAHVSLWLRPTGSSS
jgi:MFS family permease